MIDPIPHKPRFSTLKKSLINTLHPNKGFVKIYSSIAFLNFRPKWLLIVDFETEKYGITKNTDKWEVRSIVNYLSGTEYNLFDKDESICAYFKKILSDIHAQCIDNQIQINLK